jgi:hypothetical protein
VPQRVRRVPRHQLDLPLTPGGVRRIDRPVPAAQTRSSLARRNMPTRQLGTSISLATAQGWVDRAIANNEWLIITGHKLVSPTGTAEDWTPADFAALVDYVASKGVQVLPVAEALAANDAAAEGAYLTAPNGTRYRLTVGNDGALTTTAV